MLLSCHRRPGVEVLPIAYPRGGVAWWVLARLCGVGCGCDVCGVVVLCMFCCDRVGDHNGLRALNVEQSSVMAVNSLYEYLLDMSIEIM